MGAALGVLFWLLDAALHNVAAGRPDLLEDILAPPYPEMLTRLVAFVAFVALGIRAHLAARARDDLRRQGLETLARQEAASGARAEALAAEGESLRARIRDLEQAELLSREHAERIVAILGAAGAGLSITGPDLRLRYVDPELRRTHGDPTGRTCHDYFMDRPSPCPGCPADAARRAGDCAAAEAVLPRDGSRPVREALVPFSDAAGEQLLAQLWTDAAAPDRVEDSPRRLDPAPAEPEDEETGARLRGLLPEEESPAAPPPAEPSPENQPPGPDDDSARRPAPDAPSTSPPASRPGPSAGPAKGFAGLTSLPPLRLLLAEDNLPSQEALTYFLSKAGHQVSFVTDGRKVLEALARDDFDLVLMDVQMPGMDGVETVRRIRRDASGSFDPAIPVIALTAYALDGDREAFLSEGMSDYVSKPIDLSVLFAALARHCRPRGANGRTASGPASRPRFRCDKALRRSVAVLVLAEAPARLDGLRRALQEEDQTATLRLARRLAATLDLLPAPDIRPLASRLVHAAEAGDLPGARSALAELASGQEELLAALARDLGAGPEARDGQEEVRP
ncbi:MAG: response regulator [Thermodesulfobacteriota bacterium]